MKKLYVGNLAYSTTTEDLMGAFSKFGEISSANIIKDRMTGTSKGFAFIEMSSASAADTATNELNGTSLNGRNLKVSGAVDLNQTPRRSDNQRYERRN